jgi:bifunctional non-homologous end joining protein LigD
MRLPKGECGADTLMVWDHGTYEASGAASRAESDRLMEDGLKRRHVCFRLFGNKLKGEFSLVHIRCKGDKNWLLVKKKDE